MSNHMESVPDPKIMKKFHGISDKGKHDKNSIHTFSVLNGWPHTGHRNDCNGNFGAAAGSESAFSPYAHICTNTDA